MDSQYSQLADQYAEKDDLYFAMERREMFPFIPADITTLLDVGCSAGGFGKLIKDNRPGCTVWGIEPGTEAAKLAKTKLDCVINGTLESSERALYGQKFDCIVFNDVLEHMVNPETALIHARGLLTPNGVVVASIPNVLHFYNVWEILTKQDWKYEDSGIMDNTHLRFFTRKSIIRMFESAGYGVSSIEGINPSFGLKYKVANAVFLGKIVDWKFIQFAVQAQPR